jgi:type IV secretion system protein VirB10
MHAHRQRVLTALTVGLMTTSSWVLAQSPEPAAAPAPAAATGAPSQATAPNAATAPDANADSTPATPPKRTYTVPSGTKVLLTLRSAINTKSAQPGDGVYLASAFPVVVGNRVMIPAGVYVQGVVDRVQRAGHVKGRAQLDMHFTSIIFPNGSVVEVPGLVDNLPGAHKQQVKEDGEGTIQQDGDKTRNMGKVAEVSVPTGGTVGSVAGLGSGHPLAGGIGGIGAGLAAAGLVALFTRGADVNIEQGTQVEMVLQRPLILEDANLGPAVADGGGAAPCAGQSTAPTHG